MTLGKNGEAVFPILNSAVPNAQQVANIHLQESFQLLPMVYFPLALPI